MKTLRIERINSSMKNQFVKFSVLAVILVASFGFSTQQPTKTETLTESIGSIPAGTEVIFTKEKIQRDAPPNCGMNQGQRVCCAMAGGIVFCWAE